MTTEPHDLGEAAPAPENAPQNTPQNSGERFRAWGAKHPYKFGGSLFGAVLIFVIVLIIALTNWKGLIESTASHALGRRVAINGDWHVHLSFSPTLVADHVTIDNASDWQGSNPPGTMADIGELTFQIKIWPLFYGRADIPQIALAAPKFDFVRRVDGKANWVLTSDDSKPTRFPLIRSLTITDGVLNIADNKRKLVFAGSLNSHETRGDAQPFFIEGKGALNKEPFLLQMHGDSLLSVTPGEPYHFSAQMHAGQTSMEANGEVEQPFDFGVFNTTLKISGRDLANLYYFTGVAFPNTPVYNLSGQLHRDGQTYELKNLSGKVGNSDLSGTFAVDDATDRPNVTANLESKNLDFNDLGALLGGSRAGKIAPSTTPQTAPSPSAKDEIEKLAKQAVSGKKANVSSADRLLPDAPLQVQRVRDMDATVTYKADSVKAADNLPITEASLTLNLKDGVIVLDPLSLRLRQGKLAGNVKIDARPDIPAVELDMRLTDAKLDQFFPAKDGGEAQLVGSVLARAKLHGSGLSVHQVASVANGNVTLVVPHGEIRKAFAELLGINVANGLGLLWSGDQTKTDMRCAVADFHAVNGTLTADNILLDTDVVTATGGGDVNLKTESLNLSLEGHAKKFRILHLMAPITVTGTLAHPVVGVNAGKAVTQVGAAVALGAFLTPLAGILPFIDPGLASDPDCAALLAAATPKAEVSKSDNSARLAKTRQSR